MASRYWVGGTNSWNGTATGKWATTSGGASGAAEPTAADDVFFDANSGAGVVTVATTARVCLSINFTGFTGTFAGSTALTVSGSMTLGSSMTWTYSGTITFNATTAQTLTSNGKQIRANITVDMAAGSLTFQDNFDMHGGNLNTILTLTRGTLNGNNKDITFGGFVSTAANTRVLNMGNGTWFVAGNTTAWTVSGIGSTLTLNCGLSLIKLIGSAGNSRTFNFGGGTYYNLWIATSGAGTTTLDTTGTATFNNIKFSPGAQIALGFSGTSISATTFDINGTVTSLISLSFFSMYLTKLGGGTVTISFCNIIGGVFAPASTWTANNSIDGTSNVQITFQSNVLAGIVTKNGVPVEGALIRIVRQQDNFLVAYRETDSDGAYSFNQVDGPPATPGFSRGILGTAAHHIFVEYTDDDGIYNAKSLWNVLPYAS